MMSHVCMLYAVCGPYVNAMYDMAWSYVYIYVLYRGHFVEKFKGVFSLCDRDLQMTLSFRNPDMFTRLFVSGHVYQVD